MCGVAGFIARESKNLLADLKLMTDALTHRGPDDEGAWIDEREGIALGHRRLSILDLSPEGHQPMRSACGRYRIVFNGEIYNFKALRAELESHGHSFRGHSDTEVMLASFTKWGIEDSVPKFEGMFAFAVWDVKERALFLARDRFGEKPLYYGWHNALFLFASEIKALQAHTHWKNAPPSIDRDSVAALLRCNHVPAPRSIYENILKLPPGTILRVRAGFPHAEPKPYWKLSDVIRAGSEKPFLGTFEEASAELEALLKDAVKRQMISDVPLGAFLSGGIDSSLIVALMQSQSSRPVKTFTIGFEQDSHDEAPYAKAVASHLKTEHSELELSSKEVREIIPKLPSIYCEPFGDSSQIPTYLVSRFARTKVTVALSGDGGDEIFGGYNRHLLIPGLWKKLERIPFFLRAPGGALLAAIPANAWKGIFSFSKKHTLPVEKLYKLSDSLKASSEVHLYRKLVSQWQDAESVVIGAKELQSPSPHPLATNPYWIQYEDAITYLPNDILVKVDRAAMATSLETRAPFLDPRIVEFAWSLPYSMHLRDGRGKQMLRFCLDRYVPRKLIDRPKAGFAVPIGEWLKGPLREWAEDLLSEDRLKREGFFAFQPIRAKWRAHLAGRRDCQHQLWNVLMFQAWLSSI